MREFAFQWPGLLALLLLTAPLAWLLAHARKRRLQLMEAMGGGLPTHRRLRDVLRISAFIFMVFALARPGYSPRPESVSHSGRDVVFALDVSQSMLAEDAPPSRLEVAKQGIRDALGGFHNERVGLIVYAGSASILCPLTYDYDFVRYMLDQANPRTVDFGGTALQSAVEKAVDQVFMEGRGGVQDMVVLTDGGDHGSKLQKMVDLLTEKQVDVLLIGLGNPDTGAPIRLKDEEGNISLIMEQGSPVYTKLDDAALRELAAKGPRIEYVPVEEDPFDLGQLYAEYAKDRQIDAADSEAGILVYKEAGVFFLIPALILLLLSECWGAKGLKFGHVAALTLMLTPMPWAGAADVSFGASFQGAVNTLEQGNPEEAAAMFSDIYQSSTERSASPGELAAVEFNRGLCLIRLSEGEDSPRAALTYAEMARLAFLSAKRCAPGLQRAGIRIETTTALVSDLEAQVAKQKQEEDELNEQIEALIERLTALLKSQQDLRFEVSNKDVDRQPARRGNNQPPPPPVVAPEDAALVSEMLSLRQSGLLEEAAAIESTMRDLHSKLRLKFKDMPAMDTIMTEPLSLMATARDAKSHAAKNLKQWSSWPAARAMQQNAERAIERILELLSNNSSQQSDEGEDGEEMDEDYEGEETDESEESMASSEATQGDLAAGTAMQQLPVPNYSADDILMEEQGSLQFRQQKRASANAPKVEKDY